MSDEPTADFVEDIVDRFKGHAYVPETELRSRLLQLVAPLRAEVEMLRHNAGQVSTTLTAFKDRAEAAEARVKALEKEKNDAYSERNQLVSALSKLFPDASLERHPEDDSEWDDEWRWIVYVILPAGQASWHIHESEIGLFSHLPRHRTNWDGHSTAEKYRRLAAIPAAREDTDE